MFMAKVMILILYCMVFSIFGEGYLAKDGKTSYSIVFVPSSAEAAKELKTYLDRITGADFPLVAETAFSGRTPALHVGETAFARKNAALRKRFAPEEWSYLTVGKNMVFRGGGKNGSLFAVLRFLEDELGVHWFTFESEYVPEIRALVLKKWQKQGRPVFLTRSIYTPAWGQGVKMWQKTLPRFILRNFGTDYSSSLRMTNLYPGCHNFYFFVDPDLYFKSHPEYFSMDASGKRSRGRSRQVGAQLCLSNREVWKIALDSLRAFIKKDRETLPREKWPVIYDISQNDDTAFLCLCPECKAVSEKAGSDAGLILPFINFIAEAIAKEYPDVIIRTFAYVSSEKPPMGITPAKNVCIRWCDLYTRSDCYRPLTHPFNAAQRANLEAWHKRGAKLAVWDYWNMGIFPGPYFEPPRVETMLDAIAPDIRFFQKNGVRFYFTEAETHLERNPQNFIDLQVWLGYKLLENPARDEEKLITLFMDKHYGPAGAPMKEFLAFLRKAVKEEKKPLFYIMNPVREYQTPAFLKKTYETLKRAQSMTEPGSSHRLRVNKELITPIAVMLYNPLLNPGFDKKKLLNEYAVLRRERINAWADDAKKAPFLKRLDDDLQKLSLEIPTPEQFTSLPPDRIRKFAYPVFSRVEDDPDSVLGKAMASPDIPERHNRKQAGPGSLYPTWFGLYDSDTKKSLQLRLNDYPKDEKYHWYRVGKFDFGGNTFLWGFFWLTRADLRSVWTNADGLPGFNTWTVWISVKITGPEYVPGSKKENKIFLDQVILTKE